VIVRNRAAAARRKTGFTTPTASPVSGKTRTSCVEQDTASTTNPAWTIFVKRRVFHGRNFRAYSALGFVYDAVNKVVRSQLVSLKDSSIVNGLAILSEKASWARGHG